MIDLRPEGTTEQLWNDVDNHAPEAKIFYNSVVDGENTYWWQDKPLQVFTRAILYIGSLAKQRNADTVRIAALEAENKRLRKALTWTYRVSEMTGNMCRDTRRTKASGPVQAMVNRIAAQFDRIAARAKAAMEGK